MTLTAVSCRVERARQTADDGSRVKKGKGQSSEERSSNSRMHLDVGMAPNSFCALTCFLLVCCGWYGDTSISLFASAYKLGESMHHVERPLAPPFPNGACGGTVVHLPQKDIFPLQAGNSNPFLNLLNLDPLSSFENVVLPPRDVKVWLPREYHSEHSNRRFPILYCHDGQNGKKL